MKYKITFLLLTSFLSFAQNKDGYWDNIRTTNETITLKAGEKKILKSTDLPEGTTEVVFRLTLLDDNQKVSGSLVSILKSIPDPSGISQGAAGAVFLASTVSGDDKCKYAVYTSETDANNFLKTGKNLNVCFEQKTPVNKDAKVLTSSNSSCLRTIPKNLWFVFESGNWVMNEKIVLEVVPWVDSKLSTGWNKTTKQELIDYGKKMKVYNSLLKKEQFLANFIEIVCQKYTYKQFSDLLPIEKLTITDEFTEESLKKTGELSKLFEVYRNDANAAFLKGNIENAISVLQSELVNKNRSEVIDYALLGKYFLFNKQFDKSEKALQDGLKIDATDINIQLQLAHLYLFTNRLNEAKEIHKKYKNQNISSKVSWPQKVTSDFEVFRKSGFNSDDFKKILKIIE